MEGRDENDQELEGNSQTNTQVVMPTADVPTDEVVLVGDGFPAQMLYHLVIIPLRKSSKATQKHIASLSLVYRVDVFGWT